MGPSLIKAGRRLLRATASVLCVLSFLLCLGTCWLWLRSRDQDPFVLSLARAERTYEVRSRDGRLSVLRIDGRRPGRDAEGLDAAGLAEAEASLYLAVLSSIGAPPAPPERQEFAGVSIERGDLQAFEPPPPWQVTGGALLARTRQQRSQLRRQLTLRNAAGNPNATLLTDGIILDNSPTLSTTEIEFGPVRQPPTAVRVTARYALLAALTALLPATALALAARGAWSARRTARRRRAGLCPACAYDLRGTPHAARCPECGRDVTGSHARPPTL